MTRRVLDEITLIKFNVERLEHQQQWNKPDTKTQRDAQKSRFNLNLYEFQNKLSLD